MMTSIASSTTLPPHSARLNGLLVLEPPRHAQLPLTFLWPGKYLIGASDACTVHVVAEGVQPRHAMILVGDQKSLLKALDPRTWVNDSAITESVLRPGDRVSIGPITFRVRSATSDESRNVTPPTVEETGSATIGDPAPIRKTGLTKTPSIATAVVKESMIPRAGILSHQGGETLTIIAPILREGEAPAEPLSQHVTITHGASTFHSSQEDNLDNNPVVPSPEPVPTSTIEVQTAMAQITAVIASSGQIEASTHGEVNVPFLDPCLTSNVQTQLPESRTIPSTQSQLPALESQIEKRNVEPIKILEQAVTSTPDLDQINRLAARERELNQLAAELADESRRLKAQISCATERESELERKQSLLAAENERLVSSAQTTRRELADEYARQSKLWQEWDSTYRRSTEELKTQLETVAQRQTALQSNFEQMSRERSEIQVLRAECEHERREVAVQRDELKIEVDRFSSERDAFEAMRQQQLTSFKVLEAQITEDRRAVGVAQDELLALRQQVENDRTQFAAERSSESLRREQEIREHSTTRSRLNEESIALQNARYDFDANQLDLENQRAELKRQREELESAHAELETVRVQAAAAASQSLRLEQEIREHSTTQTRLNEESIAHKNTRIELEASTRTLEDQRAAWKHEREELDSLRAELEILRVQVAEHSSETLRLEEELRKNSTTQTGLREDSIIVETAQADIEENQRVLDRQRAELNREREELDAARAELEKHRAQLDQAENELTSNRLLQQESQLAIEGLEKEALRRHDELDEWQRMLEGRQAEHDTLSSDRFRSEFPPIPAVADSPVPPPIPTADWGMSNFQLPPSLERFDSSPSLGQYGSGAMEMLSRDANFEAPASLSATTMTPSVLMDFASELPISDDDHEAVRPSSFAAIEEMPSVDETLLDVNDRFGYLPQSAERVPATAESIVDSIDSFTSQAAFVASEPISECSSSVDALSSLAPNLLNPAKDQSLSDIRAQLAQLFDLPKSAESDNNDDRDSNFKQPPSTSFGRDTDDIDSAHSLERRAVESSLVDFSMVDSSSTATHEESVGLRAPTFAMTSPSVDDHQVGASQKSDEVEDAWTRRLRELSQAAGSVNTPAPQAVSSTPVAAEPEQAETASDDEYSVEAQLARLLGRPHRAAEPQTNIPPASSPVRVEGEIEARNLAATAESISELSISDRSHLSAEPTHRQNKNAVREEVQSFRMVAQMSARTALAKHSWNLLRSRIYFKVGLAVASAAAAVWYLGGYVYGGEPQLWKGITCGLTTIVCLQRLFSTSFQMNQWKKKNTASPAEGKSSTISHDNVTIKPTASKSE